MPDLDSTGPIAAYVRQFLTAARPERDWFRQAVTELEADGGHIVQTNQPDVNGGPWVIVDWRTGQTLAIVNGGEEDYETVWRPGWTDVAWIGSWLENLDHDGCPAPDWPESLPPPPPAADPPQLIMPLPESLSGPLKNTIGEWAGGAGIIKGRAGEAAELAGWTEDQVLACTASWLTITGQRYMRLGETSTTSPRDRC